jgi:hypothetical protein
MGGQPVRLGPFTGGLNTISDPTTIADTELAEFLNFEQDLDGSLKSRTPFKEIVGHASFTERIVFLCEAIFGTDHYLIGSNVNGVWFFLNGAFTLITNTFEAGAAVQYADKVYLVPKPGSGSGGKWDPSGGFVVVAAIPKGQSAEVHKERLYVCPGIKSTTNTSRLTFSNAGDLDTWPAGNFIDVRQGDGTKLVDLTIFQDSIILFKEQSSYILSYDTQPSDATLRPISSTIGVNRQFNVVNYENQVYIFSGGWVYELTNLDFLRINVKVPFVRDDTVPSAFSDEFIFLSLLEDRLICRYYRKIYVYGLRTRTWSEWESKETNLHYFGPISTIRPATGNEYYSGTCISAITGVVKFIDKPNSTDTELPLSTNIRQAVATAIPGATNLFIASDADVADINIGDYVQLYTSGDVLKEGTKFRVLSKSSTAGSTTITFTPNAAALTAIGEKMKVLPHIFCSIKTKNFDMAISHQFKRLWWWGASLSTNNEIIATITPITTSFISTWDDLSNYTWDQLNNWDQPLIAPSLVQSIVPTSQGTSRQAVKFLKAIRFIQVNFKVQLTTIGNTLDGPAKIFTLIAFTEVKQVVSKAVS